MSLPAQAGICPRDPLDRSTSWYQEPSPFWRIPTRSEDATLCRTSFLPDPCLWRWRCPRKVFPTFCLLWLHWNSCFNFYFSRAVSGLFTFCRLVVESQFEIQKTVKNLFHGKFIEILLLWRLQTKDTARRYFKYILIHYLLFLYTMSYRAAFSAHFNIKITMKREWIYVGSINFDSHFCAVALWEFSVFAIHCL